MVPSCVREKISGHSLSLVKFRRLRPVRAASSSAAPLWQVRFQSCAHGSLACVKLLLPLHSFVDLRGVSPLAAASVRGHELCVAMLLEAQSSPNIVDVDGTSPLILSSALGHAGCVGRLLAGHANVAHENAEGESALHAACETGQGEVASLLIEARAPVDILDATPAAPLRSPSALHKAPSPTSRPAS